MQTDRQTSGLVIDGSPQRSTTAASAAQIARHWTINVIDDRGIYRSTAPTSKPKPGKLIVEIESSRRRSLGHVMDADGGGRGDWDPAGRRTRTTTIQQQSQQQQEEEEGGGGWNLRQERWGIQGLGAGTGD